MSSETVDLCNSPLAALPDVDDVATDAPANHRCGFKALSGRDFKIEHKRQLLADIIEQSPSDMFDGHCLNEGTRFIKKVELWSQKVRTTDASKIIITQSTARVVLATD